MSWIASGAVVAVAAAGLASAETDADDPIELGDVVETTRGTVVYTKPARRSAHDRGRVVRGARFRVVDRAEGAGCSGTWLAIGDDAWICSSHVAATDAPPEAPALPVIAEGALVPHRYVVTEDVDAYDTLDDAVAGDDARRIRGLGGFRVRRVAHRNDDTFFKTSEGWIRAGDAKVAQPSEIAAVPLDPTHTSGRVGFVSHRRAPVRDATGAPRPGESLPAQTFVARFGEVTEADGHRLVAVGDDRFVREDDLAVLRFRTPPEEVGDDERWLEVNLTQQTLIGYEGSTPVFGTLVSTARTATPEGLFRIKKKRAVSIMKSKPEHNGKYNLDTPWVMTLDGRIAMHAVYWHDEFGAPRSHGCINLAPRDARHIWEWSAPQVPDGWVRVEETEDAPGTVVRIYRETP